MKSESDDTSPAMTSRSNISQAIDLLWSEMRKYVDAYSALKTAHGEIEQQLISADKLRVAKEKDQEKLLQEHKVLNNRVKALERSLHQSSGLQQEFDAIQTELQALKRNASKHEEEMNVRQGQLSILEDKLSALTSMDAAMKSALSALLEDLLGNVEFPETEDDMKSATDASLKIITTLKVEAKDRSEELEQLTKSLKSSSKKSQTNQTQQDSLMKEIEDLKSENKELLRALKNSESSIEVHSSVDSSELEDEIKDLNLQLELKQSDLDVLTLRLKECEDHLDEEKERNRELKDQLIALRDLHPDAVGRQSSLESTVEKLRMERSELQSNIQVLQAQNDEKEDMIIALRSAKGDLFDEAGFTALKKENAMLKSERLQMAEKFEELKVRLDKALHA